MGRSFDREWSEIDESERHDATGTNDWIDSKLLDRRHPLDPSLLRRHLIVEKFFDWEWMVQSYRVWEQDEIFDLVSRDSCKAYRRVDKVHILVELHHI
jgi:hypothetical protein